MLLICRCYFFFIICPAGATASRLRRSLSLADKAVLPSILIYWLMRYHHLFFYIFVIHTTGNLRAASIQCKARSWMIKHQRINTNEPVSMITAAWQATIKIVLYFITVLVLLIWKCYFLSFALRAQQYLALRAFRCRLHIKRCYHRF